MYSLTDPAGARLLPDKKQTLMLFNLFRKKVSSINQLFGNQYIDEKALFLYHFDQLPNISYINGIDSDKAYALIRSRDAAHVIDVLQHSRYNTDARKLQFNVTLVVYNNRRIVEVGGDYVALLHTRADFHWAEALLNDLAAFRKDDVPNNKIGFSTQTAN